MNSKIKELLAKVERQTEFVRREEERLDHVRNELNHVASEVIKDVIAECFLEREDKELEQVAMTCTGGGANSLFYLPEDWMKRGEEWGGDSLLIVVHDGPPLAPFFNVAYEDIIAYRSMEAALRKAGFYAVSCTCWYTAIYWLE